MALDVSNFTLALLNVELLITLNLLTFFSWFPSLLHAIKRNM